MKRKVTILRNDVQIFSSRVINLPIKEEFIIKKSIELFDDEEPCIIHQSYIVKEYVNIFLDLFNPSTEIQGKNYVNELYFLDFENIEELIFKISG